MPNARTASASTMHDLTQLFTSGTLVGLNDRDLLERFAARGDARAFEMLVHRHGRQVWAVCRSVLGHGPSAEDAFQATFLILVRKAATVNVGAGDSLGRWLHGVSRRVAVRARRREASSAVAAPLADITHHDTPDAHLIARELAGLVRQEVANLPVCYRDPILACYFEGLTHEQAAARLRCPVGTVKGRLSRARGVLRDRLARRGVGLTSAAVAASLASETACAAVPLGLMEATTSVVGLAGTVPAGVLVLTKGVLATMSWMKWSLAAAVVAMGFASVAAGTLRGGIGPENIAEPEGPEVRAASLVVEDGKALSQVPPNMWATAARLTISYQDKSNPTREMASGVVVYSGEKEALILTTAHGFLTDNPKNSPRKIHVDIFEGPALYAGRALSQSYQGELVLFDAEADLALVIIGTDRDLPVAKLIESDPPVVADQPLISIGCSEGADPSAWETRVLNPHLQGIPQKPGYEAILCKTAPKPGRSGGGLFNQDGELVGICSLAYPESSAGIYTSANLIRKFLSGSRKEIWPPLGSQDEPAITPTLILPPESGNIFPKATKLGVSPLDSVYGAKDGRIFPVVYSLVDLVVRRGGTAEQAEFQTLVDLITSSVVPGTWKTGEADNDPAHVGSITTFPKEASLIIRHNAAAHALIVERLRQLRRLPALRAGDAEESEQAAVKASGDRPPVASRKIQGNDPYVIEPFDRVGLDHDVPEMTLKGMILVRPDGTISLGDLGDLHVAGLTVFEVKEKLVVHLRKHYSDEVLGLVPQGDPPMIDPIATPKVRVRVQASNSKSYYVLGDVAAPGQFPLTSSTTVLDALQYAGGIGPTGDRPLRMTLVRKAGQGGRELPHMIVDLDAIMKRGDPKTNYELKAGDRLIVTTADTAVPDENAIGKDGARDDLAAKIEAMQKELDMLKKQIPR